MNIYSRPCFIILRINVGYFNSLGNLDLKWRSAAIGGGCLLGDEFHIPDVRDSCIINSLEYRLQITPRILSYCKISHTAKPPQN